MQYPQGPKSAFRSVGFAPVQAVNGGEVQKELEKCEAYHSDERRGHAKVVGVDWHQSTLTGKKMNNLSKYKLWIGGAVCVLVGGLIVGAIYPKHVSGAQHGAPPDVEVVEVEQKDVPIFGEWIGTLDGLTNADVRAQVTGYLLRQGYQEGAFVKKGQLLFEIDPRPFQAALDQAQGQLAQARAQLANAEAVQRRTELD